MAFIIGISRNGIVRIFDKQIDDRFLPVANVKTRDQAEMLQVHSCRLDRIADPDTGAKEYRWNRACELDQASDDDALNMLSAYRDELAAY